MCACNNNHHNKLHLITVVLLMGTCHDVICHACYHHLLYYIYFYPNTCSGQRALALIGWFERGVILCGGTKAQKQQSHSLNSVCWTGILVTLIGRLCGTDPYSFMK